MSYASETDKFKAASDWLAEKLCGQGTQIVYSNGSSTVTIRAHIGRRFKLADQEFVSVSVLRSELVISGSAVTPTDGHTFTFTGETWTVARCAASSEEMSHLDIEEQHEKVWKFHAVSSTTVGTTV